MMAKFSDLDKRIPQLRGEYSLSQLSEKDVNADPIAQLEVWFEEAIRVKAAKLNAMTLSTASKTGEVTSRIVLLKGFDERGLVFFTNYESCKARQIAENPRVSAVLFWGEMERQVVIGGKAEKLPAELSEAYFHSRPRDAQIAAWVSKQSAPVKDRTELENRFAAEVQKYKGTDIPLPPFWGGYRIRPESVEFWQGRLNRLNDRLRYDRTGERNWRLTRIQP